MKSYELLDLFAKLTINTTKYYLYISFNENSDKLYKNLKVSAPYFDVTSPDSNIVERTNINFIAFAHGQVVLEFDTKEECYQYYNQTHCDYNESLGIPPEEFISVYAMIIHNGQVETENT